MLSPAAVIPAGCWNSLLSVCAMHVAGHLAFSRFVLMLDAVEMLSMVLAQVLASRTGPSDAAAAANRRLLMSAKPRAPLMQLSWSLRPLSPCNLIVFRVPTAERGPF